MEFVAGGRVRSWSLLLEEEFVVGVRCWRKSSYPYPRLPVSCTCSSPAFQFTTRWNMSSGFEAYISSKFPSDGKRGTSGVLHAAFGEKVKRCLCDPSSVDKNFRFLVKKRGFQLLDLPSLGLKDVLVVPRQEDKEVSSPKSVCNTT